MRRNDALEYTRVNRMGFVAELKPEIAILEQYLPSQLSSDQPRIWCVRLLPAGATMRQIGSIRGVLMPQVMVCRWPGRSGDRSLSSNPSKL
jgi:uncharacterized protein YqeY